VARKVEKPASISVCIVVLFCRRLKKDRMIKDKSSSSIISLQTVAEINVIKALEHLIQHGKLNKRLPEK